MYQATIVSDMVAAFSEDRLTTIEMVLPRVLLAELNTHRILSKSCESSRAVPVTAKIEAIMDHPYIPPVWGANGRGMVATGELTKAEQEEASEAYMTALNDALRNARWLQNTRAHKGIVNRVIEPFSWVRDVVTGTDWRNFLALRTDRNADPAFQVLARMVGNALEASTPLKALPTDWATPYVDGGEEWDCAVYEIDPRMVSAGRVARTSYLPTARKPYADDVALASRLQADGHMVPFEHVARPFTGDELRDAHETADFIRARAIRRGDPEHVVDALADAPFWRGNFRGWVQLRKEMPGEAVWTPPPPGGEN